MPLDWEGCQVKKTRGQRLTSHEQVIAAFGYRSPQQRRRVACHSVQHGTNKSGPAVWLQILSQIARLKMMFNLDEFIVWFNHFLIQYLKVLAQQFVPVLPDGRARSSNLKQHPPPIAARPNLRPRAE